MRIVGDDKGALITENENSKNRVRPLGHKWVSKVANGSVGRLMSLIVGGVEPLIYAGIGLRDMGREGQWAEMGV